jgi:3D (Asp-Asp-Asp) domain-containing protein
MKSLFGGSAAIAAALLASSFILSATPSVAETPLYVSPSQKQEPASAPKSETKTIAAVTDQRTGPESGSLVGVISEATDPAGALTIGTGANSVPPVTYTATAYSLSGKTASGRHVTKGLIAADPSVLPLGTRVRLEAGAYSGEYLVADTGGSVRGKRIDIWTPSNHEASRFGRRSVKLTVLSYGPRRSASRRLRHH